MSWSSAVLATSPYGWWRFGEASGTTMTDSSGNARDGAYTNVGLGQTGMVPGDPTATGLLIDNANDAALASTLSYSSIGFTAMAVVKGAATDGTGGLFATGTQNYLGLSNGGNVSLIVDSSGVTWSPAYATSGLYDGNEHLVFLVVKATSAELWVDGVLVTSATHSRPGSTRTDLRLKRGSAGPLGTYQEMALWTSGLTSTEIGDLYDAYTGAVAAANATLAGTMQAKTASFSAATEVAGTLAGTLQSKTAAFAMATVLAVSLAGTTQPKTAAFTVDLPSGPDRTVEFAATLPAKTASFTVLGPLDATFAATMQAKTAALVLDTELDAALSASLQAKTAAFTLDNVGGTLPPVVLVERVRVLVDDIANPTNTVVDGTDGFTLTETPLPGDVVVVTAPQFDGNVDSITGLGGTWTEVHTGWNPLWMSTDATTAGDLTLTMAEGSAVLATVYLLRGLTSTDVARATWNQLASGELDGPAALAQSGQFVISTLRSGGLYPITFPSETAPATGWLPASTSSTTRFGEAYRIPTESTPVTHRVDSNRLSLDTRDTSIFAIGPLVPANTSLAASLRRKTAAITTVTQPIVRLVATLREKSATITLAAVKTITIAGLLQPKVATFTARAVVAVVPSPVLGPQAVVKAQAFGTASMVGTQPTYTISEAYTPKARQQIVVDGIDVTYFRDIETPDVTYTLLEPLLYGPGNLDLPQVAACFERPGYGDLTWLRPHAVVEVHRVIDDVVVGTDYKGVVVAFDTNGSSLSVELGGEANGRAALRNRQPVIFPRINDLGHQISDAVRDLGLPHYPALGTVTGIETMTTGGTGHLEHIQNLVAKAWTLGGGHWTVMPDEATGVYETHQKDETTVHATAFLDDARTVANLRRDIAEEPNRVYPTGVSPQGQRIRFGVYGDLIQGPVPPFPGYMQSGDTGDGVRLLITKLHAANYLRLYEVVGGYDFDVVEAVRDLQDDAGLPKTGEVNEATWNALYDLNITGTHLTSAHIEPAAQRGVVRQKNRSASGTVLGFNNNYDPEVLKVDLNIDTGVGLNRSQIRGLAKAKLHDSNDANWVGDIKFHTGALLRGNVAVGATVTEADVMDARELRPGMNIYLPLFAGGKLVHVSACQVDDDGIVTATVDTRFRDAMEVWEVIARNKESRNDPARRRNRDLRSSTIQKDSIGEWDEVGGLLHQDVQLMAGWNVVEVVAATEGTISRLRIHLDDPAEFVCGVFGRAVDRGWLEDVIGNPLTETGTRAWEKRADTLEDQWILFSAGTREEPCGYFPGRKQWSSVESEIPNPQYDPDADDNNTGDDDVETTTESVPASSGTLTGKFRDDAGFAYRSWDRTKVYVAVYVRSANMIPEGRILWPQLEAGA